MKWIKHLISLVVLLVIVVVWANTRLSAPIAPTLPEPQSIYLEKGDSAQSAYNQLA